MNTLIIGAPDSHVTKKLVNNKLLNVQFLINNLKDFHQDINIEEIIKYHLDESYFYFSENDQKNYQNFFEKNFNTFSFQFMRRGSKTLDIYELRNFFACYYYGFSNILKQKKIDLMIFFSFPHLGYDFILYQLAKIYNIKTILMYPTIIPNKHFMVKSIEDLGSFDEKRINNQVFVNLKSLHKMRDKYVLEQKDSLAARIKKFQRIKIDRQIFKKLILKLLIKLKIIYRDDINNQLKRYKNNLKKLEKSFEEIKSKTKSKKIIYIPLHLQPELTTSVLGGHYEDQLSAIERLSAFSKDEWIVVVKENPFQTSFQRDSFFFKRIKYLKNVFLIDNKINSKKILDISDLTATVGGTIGFESLIENKKTLVFGNTWFKNCHGVLRVNDKTTDNEINNFINSKFDKNRSEKDLINILSTSYSGVIELKRKEWLKDFDPIINADLFDKNINKFIKDNFN